MLHIGCHLSVAKGFFQMGKDALSVGADTFQFFTRNPRGGSAKAVDTGDVAALREWMTVHRFAPVMAHAPYTVNLCAADERLRTFAYEIMTDDLKRLRLLPGCFYNVHPGNHVGQGIRQGIDLTAKGLSRVLALETETVMLLETMSGKGSEIGSRFEELKAILELCGNPPNLGVCLDTCHLYSAGYDLVNQLDAVFDQFDTTIGLDRLYAVHLNDSQTSLGSRKDRHAVIGEGTLGIDAIARMINHPLLAGLPFCLETPNKLPGHAAEIARLKSLYVSS